MKSLILAVLAVLALTVVVAEYNEHSKPTIEVYKSATCSCCKKWIEHLERNGFHVNAHDVADMSATRQALGMPRHLGACHTAKTGNFLVEGHVPADDIKKLLKEKPAALGLAVPGMPPGSPGMESRRPVPYETLLVEKDGGTTVFANR